MTKQALYDAFMAGYRASYTETEVDADVAFTKWYTESVESVSRETHNHAAYDRQRDIDTEGQRAAIHYAQQDDEMRKPNKPHRRRKHV